MYTTRESHCSYRLLVGQITIDLSDGTINEGDTFQFTCTNEANTGPPTLSINDDDVTTALYMRIVQTVDGSVLTASLPNVDRSETGTILVCRAGAAWANITITVNCKQ